MEVYYEILPGSGCKLEGAFRTFNAQGLYFGVGSLNSESIMEELV